MNVQIACPCPGTPHPDGDTITLRERLDFVSGKAIRNSVGLLYAEDAEVPLGLIAAKLSEQYVLFGLTAWTLVDEDGKPVPPSRAAVLEFMAAHPVEADEVSDAADGLYAAAVIAPLVGRAAPSSPPTPTAGSTSATTASSTTRPKPSRPSSITSIPTDATTTTSASPDGDSSSSPNSESAA